MLVLQLREISDVRALQNDAVIRRVHHRLELHVASGEPLAARKARREIDNVTVFHALDAVDVGLYLHDRQCAACRVSRIRILAKQIRSVIRHSIGAHRAVVQCLEL